MEWKFKVTRYNSNDEELDSTLYSFVSSAVYRAEMDSAQEAVTIRLFIKTPNGWEFLGIFENGRQLQGE